MIADNGDGARAEPAASTIVTGNTDGAVLASSGKAVTTEDLATTEDLVIKGGTTVAATKGGAEGALSGDAPDAGDGEPPEAVGDSDAVDGETAAGASSGGNAASGDDGAAAITEAATMPSTEKASGGAADRAAAHSGVPRISARFDSVPSSDDQQRKSGCWSSSTADGRWASRLKHDAMTLFTSQSIIVVSARGGSPVVTLR